MRRVRTLRPHVVLMDIGMPRLDGLAATREVVAMPEPPRVLMLTMYDDDADVLRHAGRRVRVPARGAGPEEVTSALRAAALGTAVFGSALAGRMLRLFRAPPPPGPTQRFPELSTREQEVLVRLSTA